MTLLTTLELKEKLSVSDTGAQLHEMVTFITELSNDEVEYKNNEKKQELVTNLFRIYESIVERTCLRSKTDLERFSARDIFVEYI
jgi:flagellin-specific chaperone FliS